MVHEAPHNLRTLRQERLLTQAELAALANLTQQAVCNIERGLSRGNWRTQRRLAAALGVELEAVFPDAA